MIRRLLESARNAGATDPTNVLGVAGVGLVADVAGETFGRLAGELVIGLALLWVARALHHGGGPS